MLPLIVFESRYRYANCLDTVFYLKKTIANSSYTKYRVSNLLDVLFGPQFF